MVLGEGENFFSREKPNVGFDILPFPKPQPPTLFKKSGVLFEARTRHSDGDYLSI